MIEFRVAAVGTPEFPLEDSLDSLPALAGVSGAMNRLRAEVLRAAVGEGTVLVLGEPGSGKSLVARALHEQGPRASSACAVVPCHTLPERLLEVELFGGTSPAGRRAGVIESAQGGTVILENIELVGGRARTLLERFLETGAVDAESIGTAPLVDTRIVLTSSRVGRVQNRARAPVRRRLVGAIRGHFCAGANPQRTLRRHPIAAAPVRGHGGDQT